MPDGHDSDAIRAKAHERIPASPTFRRLVDYWAGGWGDPPDLDAVSLLMDLAAANEDREAALARLVPELANFWSPKAHVAGALRRGVATEDIPDIEIKAKAVAVGLVEALSESSTEQTVRFGRKWLKNPDGSLRPVHPLEESSRRHSRALGRKRPTRIQFLGYGRTVCQSDPQRIMESIRDSILESGRLRLSFQSQARPPTLACPRSPSARKPRVLPCPPGLAGVRLCIPTT